MKLLDRKSICCVIITYNPEKDLISLINTIISQVDKIIIVDNNSKSECLNIILEIARNERVCAILNNNNFGIAKAINQGVRAAKELGYFWSLTFDQDSKPFENIIDIFSEVILRYNNTQNLGAIGLNYINKGSGKYRTKQRKNPNPLYRKADYLITSGCLFGIDNFIKVGGAREDLFIDNVDTEFCLRMRNSGKTLLITERPGMIHESGVSIKRNLLLIKMSSPNHNYIRRYYMARNHIILSKEYLFNV